MTASTKATRRQKTRNVAARHSRKPVAVRLENSDPVEKGIAALAEIAGITRDAAIGRLLKTGLEVFAHRMGDLVPLPPETGEMEIVVRVKKAGTDFGTTRWLASGFEIGVLTCRPCRDRLFFFPRSEDQNERILLAKCGEDGVFAPVALDAPEYTAACRRALGEIGQQWCDACNAEMSADRPVFVNVEFRDAEAKGGAR